MSLLDTLALFFKFWDENWILWFGSFGLLLSRVIFIYMKPDLHQQGPGIRFLVKFSEKVRFLVRAALKVQLRITWKLYPFVADRTTTRLNSKFPENCRSGRGLSNWTNTEGRNLHRPKRENNSKCEQLFGESKYGR